MMRDRRCRRRVFAAVAPTQRVVAPVVPLVPLVPVLLLGPVVPDGFVVPGPELPCTAAAPMLVL